MRFRLALLSAALVLAGLAACEHKPSKEEEEAVKNTFACQLAGQRMVIRFDTGEARLLTPAGGKGHALPDCLDGGSAVQQWQHRASGQGRGADAHRIRRREQARRLQALRRTEAVGSSKWLRCPRLGSSVRVRWVRASCRVFCARVFACWRAISGPEAEAAAVAVGATARATPAGTRTRQLDHHSARGRRRAGRRSAVRRRWCRNRVCCGHDRDRVVDSAAGLCCLPVRTAGDDRCTPT